MYSNILINKKKVPLIIEKAWTNTKVDADAGKFKKLIVLAEKIFNVFFQLAQELEVFYYIAYAAFAIAGVVLHPFYFVFHLSQILFRYPSLKNVLYAVYLPRN